MSLGSEERRELGKMRLDRPNVKSPYNMLKSWDFDLKALADHDLKRRMIKYAFLTDHPSSWV